jgi:hypothetical protein
MLQETNGLDEERMMYQRYLRRLVGNKCPLQLVQIEYPKEEREDLNLRNLREAEVLKELFHDEMQE